MLKGLHKSNKLKMIYFPIVKTKWYPYCFICKHVNNAHYLHIYHRLLACNVTFMHFQSHSSAHTFSCHFHFQSNLCEHVCVCGRGGWGVLVHNKTGPFQSIRSNENKMLVMTNLLPAIIHSHFRHSLITMCSAQSLLIHNHPS